MTLEANRLTRAASTSGEQAGASHPASAVVCGRHSHWDASFPEIPNPTEESMKNRLTFAAAASAIALTQIAHATDVAPYFETWVYGSSTAPSTLM